MNYRPHREQVISSIIFSVKRESNSSLLTACLKLVSRAPNFLSLSPLLDVSLKCKSDMSVHANSDGHQVQRPILPTSLAHPSDFQDSEYPVIVKLQHLPRTSTDTTKSNGSGGDLKSGLYRSNLFTRPEEDAVTQFNAANGGGDGNGNGNGGGSGIGDGDGQEEVEEVKCKYVVGCDGARSWVRKYVPKVN